MAAAIMMTDYTVVLRVCQKRAQSTQRACNTGKYENGCYFYKVSVIMENYYKWLTIMTRAPDPVVMVTYAPCTLMPSLAQVK